MNILADCCAGEVLARITDERVAYANLTGLLCDPAAIPAESGDARNWLVLHTLKVLNLDGITIDSLIAFRKRERSEANGKMYTDLRHRYSERLSSYVNKLARATGGAARSTLQSEFEEDMRFDFHTLKQELRVVRSDAVFRWSFRS